MLSSSNQLENVNEGEKLIIFYASVWTNRQKEHDANSQTSKDS